MAASPVGQDPGRGHTAFPGLATSDALLPAEVHSILREKSDPYRGAFAAEPSPGNHTRVSGFMSSNPVLITQACLLNHAGVLAEKGDILSSKYQYVPHSSAAL
jgi:hypothetical protein